MHVKTVFISFIKYLVNAYYVTGTVFCTGETNKDKMCTVISLHSKGRQKISDGDKFMLKIKMK